MRDHMRTVARNTVVFVIAAALSAGSALAQDEKPSDDAQAEAQAEDNTGTNPVNFSYDFRLISEMLNRPGNPGERIS